MTKEQIRLAKNKALREWRAKNNVRLNKERRAKYAIGKRTGLSTKDAQSFRGYGVEYITKNYGNVKYRESSKVYYIIKVKSKKPKKIKEVLVKDSLIPEKKVSKRTARRRKLRQLGYTPEEADYLRDTAEDKFQSIIKESKIWNLASREKRWFRMNSKSKYDQSIVDAVEEINIDAGYDPSSRYGWAVYYFWYLNGGDIEGWKSYVLADPFNPDALGYKKENTFSF